MNQYPWLVAPYQQLLSPLLQGRSHHAWLIDYVDGSGERAFIDTFIATLLCTNSNKKPCQACHSCLLYKAGNHPDFYSIAVDTDKKFISIEQIRKLTDKVYECAQQGNAKVIWIKRATLMSESAGNALLKTVEEPPAKTYFILSDEQTKHIMPTIRSRCYWFRLPAPDIKQGIAWLKLRHPEYDAQQLTTALLLTKHAPLAADHLLNAVHWQRRQYFCELLLNNLKNKQFWPILSQLNSSDTVEQVNWFCSLLLDAMKVRSRVGEYIINCDQGMLIRLLAGYDIDVIHQWYTLWQTACQRINSVPGLNKQLILADLLAQSEMVITPVS